eukprot:7391048-Prymnesium_polylepis.1
MYTNNPWTVAGSWDDDEVLKNRAFVCKVAASLPPPPPPISPPRPMVVGEFTFVAEPRNYSAAEAFCQSGLLSPAHLATIRSSAENVLVHELCEPHECWIGFSDIAVEGDWSWVDGSPVNFSAFEGGAAPWNPGEPSGNADEPTDGAYMYPHTNPWVRAGTWDDDDVAKLRTFVCRNVSVAEEVAPGDEDAGDSSAVGTIFLILFLLGGVAGLVYYVRRQKELGQPLVPERVREVIDSITSRRASPLGGVRPVQLDPSPAM